MSPVFALSPLLPLTCLTRGVGGVGGLFFDLAPLYPDLRVSL